MAVNIGPKIGVEGEAEYRKQINNIITQTKTLSSEMKKMESSFNSEGKSISENAQKKKLLNEQIKVQGERVKALNDMLEKAKGKYDENSTEVQKWQQAVNNAETELNNLKKELESIPSALQTVGTNMQQMGDKVKAVGDGMVSIGKDMTSKVTVPIVAGLGAAIKTTMDFDAEMSKVSAISGATGDDFDALRNKAIEMGDSTKYSATESAEAMEYMAMAGWKTEDMLDGITGIMNLAAASGEELATTSDIVTDGLTAFGLSAADSTHFADVLAAASANANTNVSMLGESFAYAAPVAGSLGFSIEDTATALGLMANAGIKASQGGTALRTLFTNMANPTDTMAAAMEDLGISLTNSEGEMNSLKDIMVQLRAGFGDLKVSEDDYLDALDALNSQLESGEITQKQYDNMLEDWISHTFSAEGAIKAQTAAMLAGKTGMSGLLAIVNASDADFEKLTNSIDTASESMALLADGSIVPLDEALKSGQEIIAQYDGAAEQMAATMQDNAAGQIQILKSNIETLAISIGDLLTPTVSEIIKHAQNFVQKLTALDDGTKKMIVNAALIAAAVGPILTGLGSLVVGTGKLIVAGGQIATFAAKVGPALAPIGTAITGVASSAMAAIPGIVSFIAPFTPYIAIAAAVVAAGVLIYKNWDKIKEVAGQVGEAVAEKWGQIKEKTSEVWGNVKAKTSETWNNVKSTISTVGNAIGSNVTQSLGKIKTAFTENGGGIKGAVSAAWTGIKEYYTLGFRTLDTLTGGQLSKIKDLFVQKFTDLKNSALNWGKDIIEGFVQGIKDKINAVKDAANGVGQAVKERLGHSHPTQGPMADDYKWMPDMMKLFAKGIRNYTGIVTSAIDSVATDISVGMNGYQSQAGDTQALGAAISGSIDAASIYAAVREGASDATIVINIDGREFRRELDALGVQFG